MPEKKRRHPLDRFKWIERNLDKVATHGLSAEDVEHAFQHALSDHVERDDESFEVLGATPSGRVIWIVWRFDEILDALESEGVADCVFVITAY